MTNLSFITIEEHLIAQQQENPVLTTDLVYILNDLNLAAKVIRNEVIRFGLTEQQGRAGQENASGEDVQKLDVFANDAVKNILRKHGRFAVMGSEEEEDVVACDENNGEYVVLFDPLDGSSNIEVNVSVGTIFSIYKVANPGQKGSLEDCLQPGSKQIASGYVIYGSSVMMVYTAGNGVYGFTYDPSLGDFFLSHDRMTFPDKTKCYSINECNWTRMDQGLRDYIDWIREQPGVTARYVGSLVADFHRNLLRGGIYVYPATTNCPNGKLRLLYEANPLAFIAEQAGGSASNGDMRIMDIKPTELHEKCALYIGNKNLVRKAEELKQPLPGLVHL
ncbi:MAG: class 1 fructose-bisphosphatase [bacterium]|nr:class 1 fructose-bisphosphatase [bacterium]